MNKRIVWCILGACALVAFACVAYPIYVIRPFRAQGAHELTVALAVIRVRSFVTGLCAGLAIVMAVAYFRTERRWPRRAGATLAAIAACGFALLAHVNIYEKMFHPMGRPSVGPIAESKLDGGEEVLAVTVNGEARAYPVRILAYHHVANDALGGVPIVATY